MLRCLFASGVLVLTHTGGVYTITSPSGLQYVGSAVSFKKRWARHLRDFRAKTHHNVPLAAACEKYGVENLKFDILLICDKAMLLFYEQRALDTLKPRYNLCATAGSRLGQKNSAEHNEKVRRANSGKKPSAETLAKLKARKHTPEFIAARRAQRHSPEAIAKISAAMKGVKKSPETLDRMRAAQQARREKEKNS